MKLLTHVSENPAWIHEIVFLPSPQFIYNLALLVIIKWITFSTELIRCVLLPIHFLALLIILIIVSFIFRILLVFAWWILLQICQIIIVIHCIIILGWASLHQLFSNEDVARIKKTPTWIVGHINVELLSSLKLSDNGSMHPHDITNFTSDWEVLWLFSEVCDETILYEAIGTFNFRVERLINYLHCTYPFIWGFVRMSCINNNSIETDLLLWTAGSRAQFYVIHASSFVNGRIITYTRCTTRTNLVLDRVFLIWWRRVDHLFFVIKKREILNIITKSNTNS